MVAFCFSFSSLISTCFRCCRVPSISFLHFFLTQTGRLTFQYGVFSRVFFSFCSGPYSYTVVSFAVQWATLLFYHCQHTSARPAWASRRGKTTGIGPDLYVYSGHFDGASVLVGPSRSIAFFSFLFSRAFTRLHTFSCFPFRSFSPLHAILARSFLLLFFFLYSRFILLFFF